MEIGNSLLQDSIESCLLSPPTYKDLKYGIIGNEITFYLNNKRSIKIGGDLYFTYFSLVHSVFKLISGCDKEQNVSNIDGEFNIIIKKEENNFVIIVNVLEDFVFTVTVKCFINAILKGFLDSFEELETKITKMMDNKGYIQIKKDFIRDFEKYPKEIIEKDVLNKIKKLKVFLGEK